MTNSFTATVGYFIVRYWLLALYNAENKIIHKENWIVAEIIVL